MPRSTSSRRRRGVVVLASGQATTVAEVIATVQNVAHRRVPLALGTDPSARHQATDLRLRADHGHASPT